MGKVQVILLTALSAFLLQLILPWWIVAVGAALISIFIQQSGKNAFICGFLGVFLLWVIWAGAISIMNNGVLSTRLAALLYLPHSSLAILVTAIIGGLTGGFGALTANQLRKAL
jgi:hypothetical protein